VNYDVSEKRMHAGRSLKAIIDFSSLWEITVCDDKATERYNFRMENKKKQTILM